MITTAKHDTPAGTVTYFTITNASGASVTLSTLGAGVVAIMVPDSEGRLADVVLGYPDPASYIGDGPAAGKIPGRFANRIARGRFSIDGKSYSLAVNCGPNALHGGPTGFHNRNWQGRPDGDTVVFERTSPDGEEGYPGNLAVSARYRWDDDNSLTLTMEATTDAPTVVNLTNHTYFNLDGEGSGTALDHILQLMASRWLPTDDSQVPLGELADVDGTPMDFTSPKPLGRDIHADFEALRIGKGYDHCWAIDGADGTVRACARLEAARSGRVVEILTDQPALQLYTGNWLTGSPKGKHGDYSDYDAVAIECQDYPDAPNHPSFPSTLLRPGERYHRTIIFRFTTK